jgi:hypothetical protein
MILSCIPMITNHLLTVTRGHLASSVEALVIAAAPPSQPSIRYLRVNGSPAMMAEGRMDLLRQAVRSMLAALQIPDVEDDELHDLTVRIGHTGEWWESGELRSWTYGIIVQTHQVEVKGDACLRSCPVIFQRDEDGDELPHITPPHTPPSRDTSDASRKSSRIESGPKRSYEGMQGKQNGMARPRKKFKYTVREVDGMSSITQLNPFDPLM